MCEGKVADLLTNPKVTKFLNNSVLPSGADKKELTFRPRYMCGEKSGDFLTFVIPILRKILVIIFFF